MLAASRVLCQSRGLYASRAEGFMLAECFARAGGFMLAETLPERAFMLAEYFARAGALC